MTEFITSKVVFASSNAGKLRELEVLLAPLDMEIASQDDLGVVALPETAATFVENAIAKARHASSITGMAAIADDSGLEVDILGGAPGLYSARFAKMNNAGEGDEANNAYLLNQLETVNDDQRSARFRCVMVYLHHEHDPSPIIAQGTWEGHILKEATSGGGFGYDPVFCNNDTNQAASTLSASEKNELSHRGKAVRTLIEELLDHRALIY